MAHNKVQVYDAFGELLFLLAQSDGQIQQVELDMIDELLKAHPWSEEIKWSFDYEVKKGNDLEDLFKKVLYACHDYGPDPEYQFMIDVLEKVAEASAGIDEKERALIEKFKEDLTALFKKDLE